MWSYRLVPLPSLPFSLPLLTTCVTSVDTAIGEVQRGCEQNGYVMLVTADHGNAERMIDKDGNPVTKHTTFRGMQ